MEQIGKKLILKRYCNDIVGLFSSVKFANEFAKIADSKGKLHFIRNLLHLSVICYTCPQSVTLYIENNKYRKFKNLVAKALKIKNYTLSVICYTSSVICYTYPQSVTLYPQSVTLLSAISYTLSVISYTYLATSAAIKAKTTVSLKLLQNLLKISTKVRGINI